MFVEQQKKSSKDTDSSLIAILKPPPMALPGKGIKGFEYRLSRKPFLFVFFFLLHQLQCH
ncbi:GL22431 [Drosophila persimilis]|uniref:GL22431 n=1 Tax=Drosophila persimilis TaxID=7234 RepID=B4H1N9_DROPE|nr:GL22431 [Drosophila persimilis]